MAKIKTDPLYKKESLIGFATLGFAAAAVAAYSLFSPSGEMPLPDNPNMGGGWDEVTSPYPDVETNRLNRQAYATMVRNPLNVEAKTFEQTSVVHESRVPVKMDDPKYDVVGRIINYENGASCTATISTIKDYEVKNGDGAITFAGHCADKDGEYNIGYHRNDYYGAQHFEFITEYIGVDGNLHEFRSPLGDLKSIFTADDDLAIATLTVNIPKGIAVAHLIPDYQYNAGDRVNEPGYSGDKKGLHVDIGCKVIDVYSTKVVNFCDGHFGASGSPLDIGNNESIIEYGAVDSSSELGGAYRTFHSLFTSEFLDSVDFLKRYSWFSSSSSNSNNRQCLEVTASMLNIRGGAGTEFNNFAMAERGAHFVELASMGNWSRIQLPDTDRPAFIHNGHAIRYDC